jgi:hypothetical protein
VQAEGQARQAALLLLLSLLLRAVLSCTFLHPIPSAGQLRAAPPAAGLAQPQRLAGAPARLQLLPPQLLLLLLPPLHPAVVLLLLPHL